MGTIHTINDLINDPRFAKMPLPAKNKMMMTFPEFSQKSPQDRMKILRVVQYGPGSIQTSAPEKATTAGQIAKQAGIGVGEAISGLGQGVMDIASLPFQALKAEASPPSGPVESVAAGIPGGLLAYRMLIHPQQKQFEKASKTTGVEKAGHIGAGLLPVVGPIAGTAAEQIGRHPSTIPFTAGRALGWSVGGDIAGSVPVGKTEKAHLESGVSKLGKAMDVAGGKGGVKAAEMTRDLRTAAPDLVYIHENMPSDAKGAEYLHDLAESIDQRQQEIWDKGHEPGINRHAMVPVDTEAIANAAEKSMSKMSRRVNPGEAKAAQQWIDESVRPGMNLKELDEFVRNVNSDLRGKSPSQVGGYGPQGINARFAAVRAARAEIDRILQSFGEPGVKEYNQRWGALERVKLRTQELAVNQARREAKSGPIPSWAHVYSFYHGYGIPMIGVGIHAAGLFRKTPVDMMKSSLSDLSKSGISPGDFPRQGNRPVRGLLPRGPIPAGPSPLSAVAGSEPTPSGGLRGYGTEPQPDFQYGGSVSGHPAELATPEAQRMAQRALPAGRPALVTPPPEAPSGSGPLSKRSPAEIQRAGELYSEEMEIMRRYYELMDMARKYAERKKGGH